MSRLVQAALLASLVAGRMATEGPYSRSAVSALETQHEARVTAERRQAAQVASRRWIIARLTAQAPLVHRAEVQAWLILGAGLFASEFRALQTLRGVGNFECPEVSGCRPA